MRVLGTYNNENFGDLRDATIAFEFSHPHPLHAYGKPLHPIFSLRPWNTLNFDDLRDATIALEFSRVEIEYKTRGYMRNFTSTLLWYKKLKVTSFYGREGGSMNGATLPLSSSRPSIPPSRGHACDEEKLKKVVNDREAACEAASRARPVNSFLYDPP
jgi:hypothetical protein